MHKLDIARHIHQKAGISEREAAALLERTLDLIKATLQIGEPISIMNFGVFRVLRKAARTGRNPRTGEAVLIAARRVVTFHASLHFKAELISVQAEPQEAMTRTAERLLPKGK